MRTKFLMVCMLCLGILTACNQQQTEQELRDVSPALNGCDVEASYYENYTTVSSRLDLMAVSLIDLMGDQKMVNLVTAGTATEAVDGDYSVSFSYLKENWIGGSAAFLEALQTSLISHGGTADDAALLETLIDGFTVGCVEYQPTIYVPFYDEETFDSETWDGFPEYVSHVHWANQAAENYGYYDAEGASMTGTPEFMGTRGGWYVSFARIVVTDDGNDLPLRPFSRCWCCNDSYGGTGCSTTGGSCSTTMGACARANLWGNCQPGCSDRWRLF